MSTAWSPIRSRQRETRIIRSPHSRTLEIVPELEQAVDDPPVRPVDQLVQVEERLGGNAVALLQRAERDADHLLGALAHLLEALEQRVVRLESLRQLGQLRDRDAEVAHPLQVEVVLQHREHEPKVARDRGLARQQELDSLLDLEVLRVDVVVEGDHLVGELEVLRDDRLNRAAQRTKDELAFHAKRSLELVELLLKRDPH